jgi:Domain of unknown function (DUF4831)
MKNYFRLSIFLLITILLASCFPGQKFANQDVIITPLSDTVSIRDGSIVYGLPRTVFTVNVQMERTVKIPGPYARFAGDMIGISDAIQTGSESWSINNITVSNTEEVDPSEFYVIKSSSLFQTNVLALKREGLILDLNSALNSTDENKSGTKNQNTNKLRYVDLGSDEYFQSQKDTVYKRVAVDSSFIRIPYIVEKKKVYTLDQLAEKAAKRLMELRDGRHLILTGEATVFPQNEAPLNEINRLEKAYTELFSGKTMKELRTFSYQIIPEKTMIGKQISLFQFSELTGPTANTKKDLITVSAELIPERKTKSLTILNKTATEKGSTEFDKLYYRVPDVVNLKINMGNETLFSSRKLIYQFGEVIQLPANYLIGKQ